MSLPFFLRWATSADVPAMLDIYAQAVRTSSVSFELEPPTTEEFAARFARISARFPWLCAVAPDPQNAQGRVIGYTYAEAPFSRAAYQWSTDCALYIDASARRAGVGATLSKVLMALLTRLGYHKLYGIIVASNTASIDLTAGLGFAEEARMRQVGHKFGQWHDVVWMGLELSAPVPDPAPPTACSELSAEALHSLLAEVVRSLSLEMAPEVTAPDALTLDTPSPSRA